MPEIYGNWASRRQNIVELGTLTDEGSTAAVEVTGLNFTFVHAITGTGVKTQDEGSLDGVNWFSLNEESTHAESGVDAHFYGPRVVRYIRATVTNIGPGESVTIHAACG